MLRTSHAARPQDDLYWILLRLAEEDEGNGRKDEEDDDEPEDIPPN